VTDALTNTTTFTYDAGGRPTGVYGPDNYWQTNELNLLGQVNSTTDSAGTSVTNHYNNQGLIYAVSNAWGQVSYAEFDIHDRVTLAVDANHVTVTNAYDVAGRLRATGTPANGALQSYGYTLNVAGPTSYTNALTNVMLMAYDAYGRKTNEISGGAAGGTFAALTTNRFAYDPDGALRELTDGNQHQTRWQYDHYGRLTNKLDHLNTSAFAYGYDANSRLTSRTTPAKGTTTYGHDAVGNLTSVDYPVSADLILQYDALNRLTNLVTANTFTNSFTYTAAGLLESEDGPWANDTVSYSYTNRLRTGLALNSQPATLNLSYAWDSTKRLTNITAQAGAFGYDYVVGQASRLSRVRLPGGASITNAFDTLARMTDTHYVNPGGAVLNAHGYGLNPGNQRTSQNRMGPGYTNSVDYGYDPLGQLTTALGTEADATPRLHEQFGYQYDPAGNLKYRTNNALVQTFKVDALNQLTNVSRTGTLTVSGNTSTKATNVTVNGQSANLYADLLFATDGFTPTDGTNTFTAIAQSANGVADTNTLSSYLPAENAFTFDANGNLTFDGQKAFEYDDENQLVRVTQTNVFKTEFSYDGKMRLREKREFDGSGTLQSETRYVYDGMLLIQERDGSNTPLVSYTRGRDLSGSFAGAGGIGGLLARSDHTQTSALLKTAFYHADGNGNITALLSTNGLVVAWYQYAPFGATLAMSGPLASANTHRFSSKLWHERSGLYYYGYRFYEPNLQRWLTKDPIREAGGINLYGFVGNGPMVALDALGLAEAGVLTKPLIDPLVSIGKGIMAIVGIGGDAVAELAYPTPKEITETEMYAQRGLIAPWYDPGPVVDSSIDPRWFEVAEGAGNALLLYLPCKALAPAKGTRLGSSVAPAPEGTGNFVNLASPQRTTHILTGDATGGGHLWPGLPGKTPFPQGWSGDKVMHCVSDIATDPGLQWVQQTGKAGSLFTKAGDPARFIVIGEREAVRIKVVLEPAGEGIITAHPLP
jgi:RHS repeat-associated protein